MTNKTFKDKENGHIVQIVKVGRRLLRKTKYEYADTESIRCFEFERLDTGRFWVMDEDDFLEKYEELK